MSSRARDPRPWVLPRTRAELGRALAERPFHELEGLPYRYRRLAAEHRPRGLAPALALLVALGAAGALGASWALLARLLGCWAGGA